MSGKISTVLGAMGSGKTERLIQSYNAFKTLGYDVAVFKPKVDARSEEGSVRSRAGNTAPAKYIRQSPPRRKQYRLRWVFF